MEDTKLEKDAAGIFGIERSPGQVVADKLMKLPWLGLERPMLDINSDGDELMRSLEIAPHQAGIVRPWKQMLERVAPFTPSARLPAIKADLGSNVKGTGRSLLDWINLDRADVNESRRDAIKKLVNFGLIGGGVGLGIGAMRQLPKLLQARDELKNTTTAQEDEEARKKHDEMVARMDQLSKLPGKELARLKKLIKSKRPTKRTKKSSAVKQAGDGLHPRPQVPGVTATLPDIGFGERMKHFFGVSSPLHGRGMAAPLPYSGAMWTLLPAAVIASVIGADKLTDVVTDKMRRKKIDKRKEEVRAQFYDMLYSGMRDSEAPKKASVAVEMLDKLSDSYIEKAAIGLPPGLAPGLVGAVLATLAAGSYGLGYNMSRGRDPLAQKAKALKLILNKERLNKSVPLELVGVDDAADLRALLGDTRGTTYQLPIALKAKKKKKDESEGDVQMSLDDLYGLGKFSSFTKSQAFDPIAAARKGMNAANWVTNPGGSALRWGAGKLVKPVINKGVTATKNIYNKVKSELPTASNLTRKSLEQRPEAIKMMLENPEIAEMKRQAEETLNTINDTAAQAKGLIGNVNTEVDAVRKTREDAQNWWQDIKARTKGAWGEGVEGIKSLFTQYGPELIGQLVGGQGGTATTGGESAADTQTDKPLDAAPTMAAPDVTDYSDTPAIDVDATEVGQTQGDVDAALKNLARLRQQIYT